jgi:hypothetical protein
MRHTLGLVLLMTVAGCEAAASNALPPPVTQNDIVLEGNLSIAMRVLHNSDCAMAKEVLQPYAQKAFTSGLSKLRKLTLWSTLGDAAYCTNDHVLAHAAYVEATEVDGNVEPLWRARLLSGAYAGDAKDVLTVLDAASQRWPTFARDIGQYEFTQIDQLLRAELPGLEPRLATGRAAERGGWRPQSPLEDGSELWAHYAAALVDAGDVRHAREVAARIKEPAVLVALQADRRSEDLGLPLLAEAAESRLREVSSAARSKPRSLAHRIALARIHWVSGDHRRALGVVDEALASSSETIRRDRAAFDDGDERGLELLYWRAGLLLMSGRDGEAIALYEGVEQANGGAPVNLSYGVQLTFMGRGAAALRHLDMDDLHLSPMQRIQKARSRACAFSQTGDEDALETEVSYLRTQAHLRPNGLVDALLCAGRLEDASKAAASALQNPVTRMAMLYDLQRHRKAHEYPFEAEIERRRERLRGDAAVILAVAKVGRITSTGFYYDAFN